MGEDLRKTILETGLKHVAIIIGQTIQANFIGNSSPGHHLI